MSRFEKMPNLDINAPGVWGQAASFKAYHKDLLIHFPTVALQHADGRAEATQFKILIIIAFESMHCRFNILQDLAYGRIDSYLT